MKPNWHYIISRAVGEGVDYGWMRAYKHTDTPDADTIKENIDKAVMDALYEVLSLGDEGG